MDEGGEENGGDLGEEFRLEAAGGKGGSGGCSIRIKGSAVV